MHGYVKGVPAVKSHAGPRGREADDSTHSLRLKARNQRAAHLHPGLRGECILKSVLLFCGYAFWALVDWVVCIYTKGESCALAFFPSTLRPSGDT